MPTEVLWGFEDDDDGRDEALIATAARVGDGLLAGIGAPRRDLVVVLTDDPGIAALNVRWRDIDGPTDVLSFAFDEGEAVSFDGGPPPLGDVVVSRDTARRQADAHGWTLAEEVVFLLVHGVCHLAGHDHAEADEAARMRAEEDRLLALVAPGQRRPPTPY